MEDQDVLPLYYRHYTAADYGAVYRQAVENGKKAGLSFVVPWNVTCLDPEHQKVLVDAAPLPLKLVWWATRRPFLRLEAAAFAGTDVAIAAA